jgi:hypothetical protein
LAGLRGFVSNAPRGASAEVFIFNVLLLKFKIFACAEKRGGCAEGGLFGFRI